MDSTQRWEITYQMPEGADPHLWGAETFTQIGDWARGLLAEHSLNTWDYELTAYPNEDTMTIRATLEPRTTRQDGDNA